MREPVSADARQTLPQGPEPIATDQASIMQILRAAVQEGASDLHFKAGEPVLLRIKGDLLPLKVARLTPEATAKIFDLLRPRHLAHVSGAEVHELDFSFALSGTGRFRVNTFRQRGSLALVIRVIPNRIPDFKELGLPPVMPKLADERRGLVLVTGTTGSGKSTTLAAMINHINHTPHGAHGHDRGPDRVPAPRTRSPRWRSARSAWTPRPSRRRCAPCCARTRT